MRLKLGNGKYEYVREDSGEQYALRHGEEWRNLNGDNLIYYLSVHIEKQTETIERLTELMLVTREQAGLLQEAIIRCDSKEDIKSRVVFIIEMINKQVAEINKLEAGEL